MAHRPSLPQGNLAVPSALECFTTRFGMGRGGTTPLRARHVGIIRYLGVDCQWDVGAIKSLATQQAAAQRYTKKPNPQFLRIRGWVINGWRTDLVSHKATLQYLQRWNVSRPGSGWDGVGPLRFVHANGSECEIAFYIHNRHALDLPSGKPSAMRTRRLHMSPCVQLEPLIPVIFWGPYLTNSVSTLILGGISHLDAFSGSYVQT